MKLLRLPSSDTKAFIRYIFVGSFVGLIALVTLALSELLLSPSKLVYTISVAGVYAGGIILSYVLHKRITFQISSELNHRKAFPKFSAVAIFSAALTTGFSYIFKYHLYWPVGLLPFAGSLSFAIACLLTSAITYYLNKKWAFELSNH